MAPMNGIHGERIPLMLIHGAWLSGDSWESFGGRRLAEVAANWITRVREPAVTT